jgi:hypothetical protein
MRLLPPHLRKLAIAIAMLLIVIGVSIWYWPKPPDPPTQEPFPLPPISASPYLNTGPDTNYVGSDACRKCHEDRHASFRHTGMGRSMAVLNPADEPPDASFDHALSKRRYEIQRRDGQMWHRELLLTSGAEVLLAEYPLKFVVGSGRHSRSYFCEAEGFLVESPVTWYTAKKAWGMSPGYDSPNQLGFERAAGEGCLHCHAGRSEAIGASLHKMLVAEPAIACERCHGPGSLHVERHAGRGGPAAGARDADFTIVNPARLSRELAESICQQCHLRSSAMIVARGRRLSDFRPGLPLEDFVHAYMLETPDRSMTVVGHVEQMHLSKCYQASGSMSCLTCHDPHGEPRDEDKVAHYKSACATCHKPEHCKVEPARLRTESPANDCVQCHMPRSPTEIPHLAFTHHRIGVHRPESSAARPEAGELKPFLDLSRVPEIDRTRSLGLAFLEVANREKDPIFAGRFRDRAFEHMDDARRVGLRDPYLEASLARLRFDLRMDGVLPHAETALKMPGLVGQDRCNALYLRADELARQGKHTDALASLRELTTLRRHPSDWLLVAECERAVGNSSAADAALETAVVINPRLWKVHEYFAEQYERQGESRRAVWHRKRAVR